MNWLEILVLVFLCLSTLVGFKKGLLKQGLILFGALILLWLTSFLLPYTKAAITDHTPVAEAVSNKVESMVDRKIDEMTESRKESILQEKGLSEEDLENAGISIPDTSDLDLSKSEQTELIENIQLPDFLKNILIENNNSEIYDRLGVEHFTDYIKAYLADLVINVLSYVTTFILAYMIYRILMAAAHLVDHLPLAHGLNHGLGAILGLAEGLMILGVFFLVLLLFCNTEAGKACYDCIDNSPYLTFLYDYNPLMAIVSAVTG